jgi:tetratricopeptide (TPR) repeat protein
MSKRFRTDYLKIFIVGIPLSFIIWAFLFILAAYLTHDPYISKYSSIALTITIMIVYIYLSIKHAPKIGATIDDSMVGFKTSDGRLKCGGCGCESEVEEAFRKHKAGLSGQPTMLCPECWSKQYIAMSKMSFSLIGIAFVGGLIIHYFDPSNFLAALLINVVLLYIFMLTTVVPHELGHAIAGRLLGYKVFRVIIGYGKVLFKRRFLGWEWEFRPFPIGGVTVIAIRSSRFYRLRRFVMLLAGPLVNVIFIVLLFWILPKGGSLSSYSLQGVAPALDFFLANAVLLGLNLWPYKITTAAGVTENDGLALITIPFSKRKKIEEHLSAYYFLASHDLSRQKQYVQAIRVCEEGLGLYPDAVPLRMQLGIVFLALNEFEKARASFTELLTRKDIKPGQKMIILNNIAYTNLLSGRTDLTEEANRYSEEAYKNIPWVPAVKGTRGAVLVETGRVDEGLVLLREAFDAYSEPEGKALNAAHIALGEKLRGNTEESMRYLKVAHTLDPQCQLLNRVIEELGIETGNAERMTS